MPSFGSGDSVALGRQRPPSTLTVFHANGPERVSMSPPIARAPHPQLSIPRTTQRSLSILRGRKGLDFHAYLQASIALGANSYRQLSTSIPAESHRYLSLATASCAFCSGATLPLGSQQRASIAITLKIERHRCLSNSRPIDTLQYRYRTLSIGTQNAPPPHACIALPLGTMLLSGGDAHHPHWPFFTPTGLEEYRCRDLSRGHHIHSYRSLALRSDPSPS